MSDTEAPSTGDDPRRTLNADISKAMIKVYKDLFGRGPVRVVTYWGGSDVITVVLEDTLTPVEKSLTRLGEHERLREIRTFFQYASVDAFCHPIEQLTGRRVRSFVSGIDTVCDGLSTEVFVLHPDGYDGPSRIELAALT